MILDVSWSIVGSLFEGYFDLGPNFPPLISEPLVKSMP